MKKLLSLLLAASMILSANVSAFAQETLPATGETVIDVTDFGADPSGLTDSAVAVNKALLSAKEVDGAVRIYFPKGDYNFWPENAQKREMHLSNTDSAGSPVKIIGILVEGQDDITIDGGGSMFTYHGPMTAFASFQSENVTFENFSYDHKTSKVVDVTVEKIQDKTVTVYVPEMYNPEVVGTNTIRYTSDKSPVTGQPYWQYSNSGGGMNYGQVLDLKSGIEWRGGCPLFSGISSIEDQGNSRFAITYSGNVPSTQVGYSYQMRNTSRDTATTIFWESKDITVKNVDANFLYGFGMLGQFTENITLDSVNYNTQSERGNTTTGFADLVQMSGCGGTITINNCNFASAHDDPINIHGTYLRIVEKLGDNKIKVRYKHGQSKGFPNFYVGNEIELIDTTKMLPFGDGTPFIVTEVEGPSKSNLTDIILTLDKPLPDGLTINDTADATAVENITFTPSVVITNNVFKEIPTRGILVTTRKPVLIEGNHFDGMNMAALYISGDAHGWFESGTVADVTIRNNIFDRTGTASIFFDPTNRIVDADNPVHKNILIEGNTFNLTNAPVLTGKSFGNVVFKDNKINRYDPNVKIELSLSEPTLNVGEKKTVTTAKSGRTIGGNLFSFNACNNIAIEDNTFDEGFQLRVNTSNMSDPETRVHIADGQGLVMNKAPQPTDGVGTLKYLSSNTEVAVVDSLGQITGIGAGTAEIYAFTQIGDKVYDSNKITVTVTGDGTGSVIYPDSVTVSGAGGADAITTIDGTLQMTAAVAPVGAADTVTWAVKDAATGGITDVATISPTGLLTAKKDGAVLVEATAQSVTGTAIVYVRTDSKSAGLADNATIMNSHPENLTINSDGSITIKSQSSSGMWNAGVTTNFVLFDPAVDATNFEASVKVSGAITGSYEEKGLALFGATGKWVSVENKRHIPGVITVNTVNNASSEVTGGNTVGGSELYYRIVKEGDKFTTYFGTDGTNWTKAQEVTNASVGNQVKVGLVTGGSGANGAKITFSDLKINDVAVPMQKVNAAAPTASDVVVTEQDGTLVASYTYNDADGNAEKNSVIRWYNSTNADSGYTLVDNTNSTSLSTEKVSGRYVKAAIAPQDSGGKVGEVVWSAPIKVSGEDISKVPSLHSLSLENGISLTEAFDSKITSYTANIPNTIGQLSVSAVADAAQTVEIRSNGAVVASSANGKCTASVDTASPVTIRVIAMENGAQTATKEYTVAFNKLGNSYAVLKDLSVDEIAFAYNPATQFYFAPLAEEQTQLTISANATSEFASVSILNNGQVVADSTAGGVADVAVDIAPGINILEILVVAQDGVSSKNYRLATIRETNSDVSAKTITIDGTEIAGFDPDKTVYDLAMNGEKTTVSVGALANAETSTVAITANKVYNDKTTADVQLVPGKNTVVIGIKAENLSVMEYYTLNIFIPDESNTNLKSLTTEFGNMTPVFSADIDTYEIATMARTGKVSATAEEADASVTISLGKQTVTETGAAELDLNVKLGENKITVTVTAPNGETVKTYTLLVTVTDITYLSDMTWQSATSSQGPNKIDKAFSGSPLTLANDSLEPVVYTKGIGTHAPSEIVYVITDMGFARFTSWVGVDYSQFNATYGSVIFKVYLDGSTTPAFDSGIMRQKTPAKLVDLDVTGVKTMRLVVETSDNNDYNDHASWGDAKFTPVPTAETFDVILSDVSNIVGEIGSRFDLPVAITAFPTDAQYKSIEGVVSLPEGVTVVDAKPSDGISECDFDFNVDGNKLRFAFIATDKENPTLSFDSLAFKTLLTLTMEMTAEKAETDTLTVAVDRLTLKSSDTEMQYDVTSAVSNLTFAPKAEEVTAAARQLYVGDSIDLIGINQKAIAVEFTGIDGTKAIALDSIPLYFSSELTEVANKSGVVTYVAIVDAQVDLSALNAETFTFAETAAETLRFGDTDNNGNIDAQDALSTLSAWLRKTDVTSDQVMLSMNVNADSRIDTSDAIDIVDWYISTKPFTILSK